MLILYLPFFLRWIFSDVDELEHYHDERLTDSLKFVWGREHSEWRLKIKFFDKPSKIESINKILFGTTISFSFSISRNNSYPLNLSSAVKNGFCGAFWFDGFSLEIGTSFPRKISSFSNWKFFNKKNRSFRFRIGSMIYFSHENVFRCLIRVWFNGQWVTCMSTFIP